MGSPLHERNGKHRRSSRDVDRSLNEPGAGTRQPADPLAPIVVHLTELVEFLKYYLATRLDKWRMGFRAALYYSFLGVALAIVAATTLVAATIFVLRGASAAVAISIGQQNWLGEMVIGGAILGLACSGGWFWARWRIAADLRTIIERYERQKQSEREDLGTDVSERAARQND